MAGDLFQIIISVRVHIKEMKRNVLVVLCNTFSQNSNNTCGG